MSYIQKYVVGLFVLTGFAALAYAGGEEAVSFPTPLEKIRRRHTSELQSLVNLVCRLMLEKKTTKKKK